MFNHNSVDVKCHVLLGIYVPDSTNVSNISMQQCLYECKFRNKGRHSYANISHILKFILMVFTNLYILGSCHPEGFVIRTVEQFPYDNLDKHVAKFVRAGHVQTEESWKRTWRQAKLNKLC